MSEVLGTYAPSGTKHINDAQFFNGETFSGTGISTVACTQPMTLPIGNIGMTVWVTCSKAGTLTVEEFIGPVTDPDTMPDNKFEKFEAEVAVSADTPKKVDYSSTFRPLRFKFTPGSTGVYTLKLGAKHKGS